MWGAWTAAWPLIRTDLDLSYVEVGILLSLPHVSRTVLEELTASVGGDRAFVLQLIEAYLSDSAAQLEVIESAPEVRSMTSQARAAKLSRTINTTAADVRSAPTGQSLRPVPEARPCVTADLPEVRRNLHAPPSITLLARTRWRRPHSQYYAAGSESSRVFAPHGVDQSRAACPDYEPLAGRRSTARIHR